MTNFIYNEATRSTEDTGAVREGSLQDLVKSLLPRRLTQMETIIHREQK